VRLPTVASHHRPGSASLDGRGGSLRERSSSQQRMGAARATDYNGPIRRRGEGALPGPGSGRRIDTEAIALARQGELGYSGHLRPGGRPRSVPGRALALATWPSPTIASTGLVAWLPGLEPDEALRAVPGVRQPGGWDPAEHNFHLYPIVIGAHDRR